jgi:putative nucleotidyltransferase with HDIG domain
MPIKKIPTSQLKVGMYLHKLGGSWLQHPFMRSSFLIEESDVIKKIYQAGIKEVFIDNEQGKDIEVEYVAETQLTPNSNSDDINPTNSVNTSPHTKKSNHISTEAAIVRSKKLCQSAKQQVIGMFDDVRIGKAIDGDVAKTIVDDIAKIIDVNADAMLSVSRLKTHDDYTFMHCVAVCALMIALAKKENLDAREVELAGLAGLLHDLGKAFMPLDVLNKPGRLTDQEFDVMKTHPQRGADMLSNIGLPKEVVDVVLHHHEKINGTGYPHGLKDNEISLLSRMGAICDVYDAVTSIRPYKDSWDPAIALRRMASWDGHFDKKLFSSFISCVGIYPIGSLVRLASQRLAVVVEPSPASIFTPIVKVFFSTKLDEPIAIKTIDLSKHSSKDKIEAVEDSSKWNFPHLESLWQ